MKKSMLLLLLAVSGAVAVGWANPPAPESSGEEVEAAPVEETEQAKADLEAMDRAKAEVESRLGISAPMELTLENGVDPVAEARSYGLIVDATLEEVEAALAAAKETPEIEDDQQALILKVRGSYRFYAPTGPAQTPQEESEN